MNVGIAVVLLIAAAYLLTSIRIIPLHERAVIFRLGRLLPQPKGPGIFMVTVPLDRVVRVSLAEQQVEVPAQDVTTKDEMTRQVDAEVAFRVLDPVRAIGASIDYRNQIMQLASQSIQTTCREVNADEFSERAEAIGASAKRAMESAAAGWGVQVIQVIVEPTE